MCIRDSNGSDQIWQIKVVFNALGLVGFIMFVVSFAKVLLKTSCFSSLRAEEEVLPSPVLSGREKTWFWVSSILGAVFSFVVYMFGYSVIAKLVGGIAPQSGPAFIEMCIRDRFNCCKETRDNAMNTKCFCVVFFIMLRRILICRKKQDLLFRGNW